MKKNLPITIFGDGQQTRDFVYVKDIAHGIFLALIKPLKGGDCLTCNIGNGRAISLIELVNFLKNYFPQWTESINFLPARLGDIIHSQANISKASSQLNYQPTYTTELALSILLEN